MTFASSMTAVGGTQKQSIPLNENIDLTKTEREIFDRLLGTLCFCNLDTQLRVAGVWVRDKVPDLTYKNEKDLSTGFLTYHTLSSSFQDNVVDREDSNNKDKEKTKCCEESSVTNRRIPLPPFGLTTYKMQGDLWGKTGYDQERLIFLQSAADSCLKQLYVDHHDYNFFLNSNFYTFINYRVLVALKSLKKTVTLLNLSFFVVLSLFLCVFVLLLFFCLARCVVLGSNCTTAEFFLLLQAM